MAEDKKISYHIDAGGETELSPRAYQESILHYRDGVAMAQLEKLSDDDIAELFHANDKE